MTQPPFVVFGMPRSRTAWLSRFLTYRGWFCGHDELRHARSLGDVRAWLQQPSTGTVETAAAAHWRLAQRYRPDMRVVVVRRPLDEVADSLHRAGLPRDGAMLAGMDAKLRQIAARVPGALSVTYADLATEDGCAAVFTHCLPYSFDQAWWRAAAPVNMQVHIPALVRYVTAFGPQLNKLAAQAKQQTLAMLSARPVLEPDGVTLQLEPFDAFFAAAQPLFEEHLVQVGEDPRAYLSKNIPLMQVLERMGALQVVTARCNGRMFGYLMTVMSPSMESPDVMSALHTTFFASAAIPGLGRKLQRFSADALRRKGVDELFLRAGPRGDGPKMPALYRRLGAEDCGQMFRLDLAVA